MNSRTTYLRAFSYIINSIRPFPLALTVMFWVAFFSALDLSIEPYLIKVILNRLADNTNQNIFIYLAWPIFLYIAMHVIISISYRLYDYFVDIKMIPNLRKKIASESLERLLYQSHDYYQNNFSGNLSSKVNDLTISIPEIIQIIIDRFFCKLLSLLIAIYTLWTVNYSFAIGMFTWTAFFIAMALVISKRLSFLAAQWSECNSEITGNVVDVLSNITAVRLFSSNKREQRFLNSKYDKSIVAEQKLQWSYFWMWAWYGLSSLILQIFNFYFLLKGYQEGWVSIGDFALVLMLNIAIVNFLWEVARDFSQFSKLLGRVTQALGPLLTAPEIVDDVHAANLVVKAGRIEFENVKFNYKQSDLIFNNKSITIAAGQKVGLVGYSGSGKSTFVNLILRLYDVIDGRIMIDGQDIRKVTQDSLHNAIAMIPQDPSLFHRSLAENIGYGDSVNQSDDEPIILAAKRAHAHGFIVNLSAGYQSMVGERGIKLSGGQRQRIAIARAILKNSPILILDEATSQLDSLTERYIQESVWELMQSKTTIIIAHRLSTLLNMDRILVFDQGKIVEDGTHTELLAKNGLYKKLWDTQVNGFI